MSAPEASPGEEKSVSVSSLRGPILRQVSRSFYLSIFLLPKKLRDPVSLGYLLARAADTITRVNISRRCAGVSGVLSSS